MNTYYGYFDAYGKIFYDPRRNGAPVFGWAIPRLDAVRFRIAITYGKARINTTTGIPLTQYQYDIRDYNSSLYALKSNANYIEGGPLDFSNGGGFETGDTAWHAAAICCVTLAPIVVPITIHSRVYNQEIVMLKTGQRWTLRPDSGEYPPPCEIQRDVYTGNESNAPSGLPGGLKGPWTISGASVSTDISIPNCTSQCQLAIGVLPPTNAGDSGQIMQQVITNTDPTLNVVRLSVGASPGTGGAFNGNWTLLNL